MATVGHVKGTTETNTLIVLKHVQRLDIRSESEHLHNLHSVFRFQKEYSVISLNF